MRISVRSPISQAARAPPGLFKDPASRPKRGVRCPALPRRPLGHLLNSGAPDALRALDVEKRKFPSGGPWVSPRRASGSPQWL